MPAKHNEILILHIFINKNVVLTFNILGIKMAAAIGSM